MKNVYLLPTDKPSKLCRNEFGTFCLTKAMVSRISFFKNQNIYITSDEYIEVGDYFYSPSEKENKILKFNKFVIPFSKDRKIILTTDQDLINDGVQAIDDEFLEWFVKNPSCEYVEVTQQHQYHSSKEFYIDADYVDCSKEQYQSIKKEIPTCPLRILYKTIIPQKEPKQETLEEAAKNHSNQTIRDNSEKSFIEGVKWQAERMYSEEDMKLAFEAGHRKGYSGYPNTENWKELSFDKWFEQYKK